ncbi:RNA-metabolizing metallo-beta-lactamase [Phorcysia thermohydrogeniphila]|uniref:RNA-metabolizing metallo-beta-lactamase n=2 Tax=Phorcysia thermohydrogeniphila TaxID=936138 RepID=A0A4R1GHW1_9BACT|nr:RNA-metabolizing metallo-beta-lactamase [Phorcysia thermohydrogeniphila]
MLNFLPMENLLVPIGGGNEIGASAYLYLVGGKRILVDSGIRFNPEDPYPDFSLLKSLSPELDAIVITHAHVDHCGSVHLLSSLYPETPIYTTHETAQLLSLMVEDAIKVRYIRNRNSPDEWREYRLLDEALSRLERRDFYDRIVLGDVEIVFYPAGHILGAASVGIFYGDSGFVYHTGDISLTPQLTTGGAELPSEKPTLLVSESTYYYSDRKFSREEAIEEFYSTVKETVERKGKILIPVFALGRAQEIMLLLSQGMREGKIPPLTVYVDGLAKEVSVIYENLLERELFNFYVQPAPRYEGLSFEEACMENLREADCIVSTSGMLMEGTPSFVYAQLLSKRSSAAIIFSGYMVEESFGYRLLHDRNVLRSFRCRIERHHFSAHADKGEIETIVERLSPEKTVFVHGYPNSLKQHGLNREVIRF